MVSQSYSVWVYNTISFVFILYSFGCQPDISKRIKNNTHISDTVQLCKIYERTMLVALEACPDFKDRFSFCQDGTDNMWNNYCVEVDSICWNIKKSYSNGVYGAFPYLYSENAYHKICNTKIFASAFEENSAYSKLFSIYRNRDTSNLTTVQDPNFKSIHFTNYNQEFTGHQYRIFRARVTYRYIGIKEIPVVNFFPDKSDEGYRPIIQVPLFEVIGISDIYPVKLNIKDCME